MVEWIMWKVIWLYLRLHNRKFHLEHMSGHAVVKGDRYVITIKLSN